MEKRFTKVVKNPKTGRTRTIKFGQAGKAADGGDRIRPGTSKGMPIALVQPRSKVIGSLIPIRQTTFHAVNGSAEEANQ
jgi:hypothetical protein